jgi:hypothetical protein
MTATTPRYDLRHPERTDPAQAWTAFAQLAEDTEDAIGGVDDRLTTGEATLAALRDQVTAVRRSMETNTVSVSFTNRDSHTVPVRFARPFPAQPVVLTNIASGAGPTARWISRAINITPEGFTLFVFAATDNLEVTWNDIPVHWAAIHHD